MGDKASRILRPKKTAITEDYELSPQVLGVGINGKVLRCYDKKTRKECALKVICVLLNQIFPVNNNQFSF